MKSEIPSVTIGIPLYNEEQYIQETLESAINQTYKNCNIVVSDNNSQDNSFEIVTNIAKKYKNVSVIKQVENIGATGNFEFLLKKADSKYFMWLGSHDIISETYIEESVKILEENSKIILTYHKSGFFLDNVENIQKSADSNIDTTNINNVKDRMFFVASNLVLCTAIHGLFRTDIIKQIPFKNMIGPDNLILFTTAEKGHIKNINKLGFYRRDVHVNEKSNDVKKRYEEYKMYKQGTNNPHALFIINHIKTILKASNLSFFDKLKLTIRITKLFRKNSRVSRKQLIKQLFARK